MFLVEEMLTNQSQISLSKLKTRKNPQRSIPTHIPESPLYRNQTPSNYFSFHNRKEIFLFKPPPLKFRLIREISLKPCIQNSKSSESISTQFEPKKDFNQILQNRKKKLDQIENHLKRDENELNFFKYVKNNNENDLNMLLITNPELVNSIDSLGMTGLHWAAKRNFAEIGKILISFSADVLRRDMLNRNCRDIAKKSKSREFLKMIAEALKS
jgi:hypothetical protein